MIVMGIDNSSLRSNFAPGIVIRALHAKQRTTIESETYVYARST
jgi:hypothetical protein